MNLLHLAAALSNDLYNVKIVDCHVHHPDDSELSRIIHDSIMVGISSFTGLQSAEAIRIASTIKQINPKMPIIWGGYHPSIWHDIAIESPLVDSIVAGTGESIITKIAENVHYNRTLQKEIHYGYSQTEIPSPQLNLIDTEKYLATTLIGKRVASISTSYGCPHNCSFCAVARCFQNRWIAKSSEQVVDEIEYISKNYQIDGLEISDNAPFIDRIRMLDIAKSILARNIDIRWMSMARVDELLEYSSDEWQTFIESGFSRVFVGIESGDQLILDKIGKKQNTDQYLEFALQCSKHKLIPDYSFTLGYPSSEFNEIENTFNLIRKLKKITPSSTVMLYQYTPYYHTAHKTEKLVFPENWEEWGNEKWRDYSLTGKIKPWMNFAKYKKIKEFETVLSCRFYRDEKVFPQNGKWNWLINSLVSQAESRWDRKFYSYPYELKILRRSILFFNNDTTNQTLAT